MVYQWKTSGLYKISADTAGAEVEKCRGNDGVITPAAVVRRASDEQNALHVCFEWHDGKAAEKWREHEARVLIGNIVTVVRNEPDEETAAPAPIPVRAFVNVSRNDERERGYKNIVSVLHDDNDRTHLLSRALGELRSFKQKYAALAELAAVFGAIDSVSASDSVNAL